LWHGRCDCALCIDQRSEVLFSAVAAAAAGHEAAVAVAVAVAAAAAGHEAADTQCSETMRMTVDDDDDCLFQKLWK